MCWAGSPTPQSTEGAAAASRCASTRVRTSRACATCTRWSSRAVPLDWLLLPKTEDAADIACVSPPGSARAARRIAALIETPLGIERAFDIARHGAPLRR